MSLANPWHISVLALGVALAGQLVLIVSLIRYCGRLMRRLEDGPTSRAQAVASPPAQVAALTNGGAGQRAWRVALPQLHGSAEHGDCASCTGLCCRYITLPLERPTAAADYDWVRYLLAHEGVLVFVTNDDPEQWYVEIGTPCAFLTADHRCGIYANRPQLCRDYSTEGCDQTAQSFADFNWKCFWRTADTFEQWLEEHLGDQWRAYRLEQRVWNTSDPATQGIRRADTVGTNGSRHLNT